MSDIFLSYASEDRDRIQPLVQALEHQGWFVWWDPRIRSGTPFDRVIEEELARAACVIVVWSHRSVDSDWVRAEAADGLRRRILIAVSIEKDVSLPVQFSLIHTVQLAGWDGTETAEVFQKLVADVEELIGIPPQREVVEPPIDIPLQRPEESGQQASAIPEPGGTVETPRPETPLGGKRFPIWAMVAGPLLVILILLIIYFGVDAGVPPKTITNRIGMEFVLIPAGTFMMGSTEGADDEQPVHQVVISQPFYLGKYEVTQKQWEAVMGNNPSGFEGDDKPVEFVSWWDIQKFIRKLNEREGGPIYRLPTEAEWEYAARAGTTTAYSFGDDSSRLDEYAWYNKNSGDETHPIGQRRPNPWGLYDMHGNVYEWVQDWYGKYPKGPVTNPQGPSSGSNRLVRGGSWYNSSGASRSANRFGSSLGGREVGFRLLRTAP